MRAAFRLSRTVPERLTPLPSGHVPGPFPSNSDILLGMEIYTAIAATVGAVTGMLAAAASLWNSYQFSVLKGRVDEFSAHSTAAYARPR